MANPITSLHDLIVQEFGVSVHDETNPITDSVGIVATKICNNNPRRVSLTVINLGSNPLFLAPDNDVSIAKGIYVGANGGSMALDWRTDMEIIAHEWWGIAPAGADSVYVLSEVIG